MLLQTSFRDVVTHWLWNHLCGFHLNSWLSSLSPALGHHHTNSTQNVED
uniref:Uncharacterized protein n=1 Tax=Anguilla anguilla TaxID=7936 RepID=A0A0E9T479_ANGAN